MAKFQIFKDVSNNAHIVVKSHFNPAVTGDVGMRTRAHYRALDINTSICALS